MNKSLDLDCNIRSFIERLNLLPEVETLYSCDGHGSGSAYVFFKEIPNFLILPEMYEEVLSGISRWKLEIEYNNLIELYYKQQQILTTFNERIANERSNTRRCQESS